jgi:hypothetical protein
VANLFYKRNAIDFMVAVPVYTDMFGAPSMSTTGVTLGHWHR